MAAIDKVYVHDYYEFEDLVEWALIYYPTLLRYFYNWRLTYSEYSKRKKEWVKNTRKIIINNYKKLGKFKTKQEAVSNVINYYKSLGIMSSVGIEENVEYIISQYQKSNAELEDEYSFPVCNLRIDIDNYLKWHCPLSFIRKYLHEQCGVNKKWEWFYKLFWKGKKEFL